MSCQYRINGNHCRAMNMECPWVYWCTKIEGYKENFRQGETCKYLSEEPVPDGYCRVEFERHGYLYIRVDTVTVTPIRNPFNDIPKFVKVLKLKNGEYKLKK